MTQVVTFENYVPPARYDGEPWTTIQIEEAALSTGTWALLDTLTISPVDADPENPAAQSFTTTLGTAADLWYRVIFVDADGDATLPTEPVQNSTDVSPYATVDELFRLLKIRTPTPAQTVAGERVLSSAAGEINAEIDLDDESELSGWQLALAAEVNLERAVEHWRDGPFGLVGLGDELGTLTHTARNTWERYAHKLAPLKGQWGLA